MRSSPASGRRATRPWPRQRLSLSEALPVLALAGWVARWRWAGTALRCARAHAMLRCTERESLRDAAFAARELSAEGAVAA